MMKIIGLCYGFVIIYFFLGVLIWEKIDIKTRYMNKNDEYLKLPIILGSFFSLFFINKIKKRRRQYVIHNTINDINIKIMFLGYDGISDTDKENYKNFNRIIKLEKIKNKI